MRTSQQLHKSRLGADDWFVSPQKVDGRFGDSYRITLIGVTFLTRSPVEV